jgi:4-amino-4-deoxy-L-arabinose transferase-like glycosyltransferase
VKRRLWERSWLVGVVVAVAHIGAAAMLSGHVGVLYEDGADFHTLAARLARDFDYGPPEAFRPPGWPMLLALPYRLFGAHPNVGLVLNAVLAGLTVVVLIRLGERLGLTGAQSTVAGVAYGLFPWVLVIGASLYSETLFNLLTVCLCLMVVELRERPVTWWWFGAGLIAGYATLVRSVMVFWLPAGLLFALGRKLDWRAALGIVLGIAIIIGPWTWRNYERLDEFVPLTTAGGLTIALANNDVAGAAQARQGLPPTPVGEVETDHAYSDFAMTWIQNHPGEFAKRVPERIVRTFDPMTRLNKGVFSTPPLRWAVRIVWIAALVFIGMGLVQHHRRRWLVPLSFVLLLTPQVAVFGGGFRFLIPALPFLALWGVAGVSWMSDRLRHRTVDFVGSQSR